VTAPGSELGTSEYYGSNHIMVVTKFRPQESIAVAIQCHACQNLSIWKPLCFVWVWNLVAHIKRET